VATGYISNGNGVDVLDLVGVTRITTISPVAVRSTYFLAGPVGTILYLETGDATAIELLDTSGNTNTGLAVSGATFTAIWGMCLSADATKLYVCDSGTGGGVGQGLHIIDTATHTESHFIAAASTSAPEQVALSPDGTKAYITDITDSSGHGNLLVIDLGSLTITHTLNIGLVAPEGIAVTPDGTKAYISGYHDNTLTQIDMVVVDLATPSVITTIVNIGSGFTTGCSITAAGDYVYTVTAPDLAVIKTATNTLFTTVSLPNANDDCLIEGSTVYCPGGLGTGSLYLVDAATNTLSGTDTFAGTNAYQTYNLIIPSSTPLSTQGLSAYGAGYAALSKQTFYQTQALSAYGAGYAPLTAQSVLPIPPTEDGYAFLTRTRTFSAVGSIFIPPVPPPAQINLADLGIPRVSEFMPPPTVITGIPYNDSVKTPWAPTAINRSVWAKQLQVLVGGEDVTFFRGLPTEIESWASQEPFGDSSAVFRLPGVTSFDQLRQPLAVPVGATVGIAGTPTNNGYWTASALGLVTAFGDASFFGDPLGLLNAPVVGIASSPTGYGYVLAGADGGAFCFGSVPYSGSLPGLGLVPPTPIVGIATTSTGRGYWMVDAGGQVYAFGDAPYLGNASFPPGVNATAICRSGNGGYIIVSARGDVDCFGCTYHGNGIPFFVANYVGVTATPGVDGYVLVNTLGEAYAFGAESFEGSVTFPLNLPANSIAAAGPGGYWIGAQDGGVFAFGNAQFYGSVPGGGTTSFGSLSWLALGVDVTINAILSDNSVFTLFEGVVADWEDAVGSGSVGISVQCIGCLFQLDWYIAKPIPNLPFQGYSPETGNPVFGWDIAQAIPTAINSVASPTPGTALGTGWTPTPRPTPFNGNFCVVEGGLTGILTVIQPAWDKLLTSYIQNVLAQAETFGGFQYTVALLRPRTPVLRKKDFTGTNWTIATGAHGISHDLSLDQSTAANAIYGSGTAPPILSTIRAGSSTTTTGLAGTWQGAKYPQFPPTTGPVFPLGPGGFFAPGDGQTGLQPFTNWMRQSGWPMVSQDTYLVTAAPLGQLDYYLILQWQTMAGLEQTGTIDVDTWERAFDVGWNTGSVSNVYYAPLAELAEVEPYAYTPSGAFLQNNPFYNSMVPRIERYEAMGSQVSKAQGVLSATIELGHVQVPTWTGTIELTADPEEGSRFEILAGQNILLKYFHGRDVLFHISNVSVDFANLKVSLTVSAQPLDLLTLAAIYARDTQAHGVARQARPSLVNLNVSSNTTTFDSESSAGMVPPVFVQGGTWSVFRMAASQSGSIAETNLTASPPTPFAVGVFSGPVTPSDMEAVFTLSGGSPLNNSIAGGNNPWNEFATFLDALGLLYGAGGPGGACGFWPSDPNGTQTLSGRYVDAQTWPYSSAPGYSPWLWVAFYAQNDCFVSGRFLPAPSTA
jgi:DNA-binding beta-propeller fold protein YncE